MRFKRTASIFIGAVFLSALMPLGHATREIVIVSPHWEGVRYEFGRAFASYYLAKTGEPADVHWRDLGGTSQIEQAIDAGYKATPQSCQMDVLFGGGIDPFENQKREGHLEPFPLPAELLQHIPRELGGFPIIDPENMFYGAALSSFGILENERVLQKVGLPSVSSWSDLCDPRVFGWVSSCDPRKSGSVHMIYEIILQAYASGNDPEAAWKRGWEIIYQMSGNTQSFLQSSSAPTKEVATGQAAYAVSIDINGLTQQALLGPENVRFKIPAGVSVINPDGIAILKGAPHEDVAREFVLFVMSRAGQSLWMTPTGQPGGAVKFGITRMGVWPELYPRNLRNLLMPLNPFQTPPAFLYDFSLGGMRWNVVNDLLGQTVIDVHPHLVRAWAAINRLPMEKRTALLAEFNRPPVTAAEALQLASFWKKDRIQAGRIAIAWMSAAVEKYKRLETEADREVTSSP